MKIAIIIFVLSCLLFFIKVEPQDFDSYDKWVIIKFISFIAMIISFIAIVIMW